jgi:hypothetical protein
MDAATLDLIGERVDRLITLDVRGRGRLCPIMERLYPAAREIAGRPVTALAASRLAASIKPKDPVLLVTGMACYGLAMETDGPVGALALGRALQVGLGARPIVLTHQLFAERLASVAASAGFFIAPRDQIADVWERLPSGLLVEGFPTDEGQAAEKAQVLVDHFKPRALIAIEARGPNREGQYHVVDGKNMTPREAKFGSLFALAEKDDWLTIGIFDGCGHEIGFGTIAHAVEADYPRYGECACGCPSGMHDATRVDIPLPAATSNWGAYGIDACLSALLENEAVLHTTQQDARILRACADAGAVDGLTGRAELSVDGLPEGVQASILEILHAIVQGAFTSYAPGMKTTPS